MYPAPVLDIEGVVVSREHDHLVGVEDGGAVPASQHPEHPVPEERGRPVPRLGHGWAQLPGVGLHPPPVAGRGDIVILCSMFSHKQFAVCSPLILGSYKSFIVCVLCSWSIPPQSRILSKTIEL